MSTIRVVNLQHTDATEPNIVLESDGTAVFASGITISGGTNLTVSGTAEFASGTVNAPGITFIDDNNTGIYSPGADQVAISTNGTAAVTVDASQRVGVGTTSPSTAFEVQSASNTSIRIDNEDDSTAQLYFHNTGSTDMKIEVSGGEMTLGTGTQERMRIDSSGRLLLGYSSVFANANADDLQIGTTTTANVGLTIGSSTQGQIAFADAGDPRAGLIHYQHSDNSMRFYTSGPGNERMRIDSSGNVGIGTTSVGDKLTIQQGVDDDVIVRINGADNTSEFCGLGVDGGAATIVAGGSGTTSTDMVFKTAVSGAESERMRILSGGGLTFNGDTATANALDDYEEGSWTPTIANLSLGNGSLTGHYTKIGNIVHVSFRLAGGSTTTFTSTMNSISGLPFTNALAGNSALITASNPSNNWIGWTQQYGTGTSCNYIQFVTSSDNHAVGSGTIPFTWGSSTYMRFNMTYRVA